MDTSDKDRPTIKMVKVKFYYIPEDDPDHVYAEAARETNGPSPKEKHKIHEIIVPVPLPAVKQKRIQVLPMALGSDCSASVVLPRDCRIVSVDWKQFLITVEVGGE